MPLASTPAGLELDPRLLDVVMTDVEFVLYYGDQPLTTPGGRPISHPAPRLLQHIQRELILSPRLEPGHLDAYGIFSVQKDLIEGDPVASWPPEAMFYRDPMVTRLSASAGNPPSCRSTFDPDRLDEDGRGLALLVTGLSGVLGSVHQFFQDHSKGQVRLGPEALDTCLDIVRRVWAELPPERRAAALLAGLVNRAGLLLPLLLVTGAVTPSEYAHTLFNFHPPRPNGETPEEPEPVRTLSERIGVRVVRPDWANPRAGFNRLHGQASALVEYLACCSNSETATGLREMIASGEGYDVEFKSTLRWNLKAGKKDASVEHASLKTIAAFLNSSGGTLLIGVRDDGSAEGIETDDFPDEDKFGLHFWNLVKSSLGPEMAPFIRTDFEKLDGRTVYRVRCARGPRPAFLRQKGFDEAFYIRVGPSSAKLGIAEALEYIGRRFQGG
ncbi:MAG: ATP-binding protein [Proteobacteria bacterium]|nr:ATP-binding protein [Pseudomonadota bacterium]